MAKKSQIYRDRKRAKLIEKYADRRAALRGKMRDPELSLEDKQVVQAQMDALPRNSCSARLTRRCELTGRARGGYRQFKLSRIMVRKLALEGKIPGMTKSSW